MLTDSPILVRSPLRERPRVVIALVVLALLVAALFVGAGSLVAGGSSEVPPKTAVALRHARQEAMRNGARAERAEAGLRVATHRVTTLAQALRVSQARLRRARAALRKARSAKRPRRGRRRAK